MSGKYSDVRLAYTPDNVSDSKGELFFKIVYLQEGQSLTERNASDEIRKHFMEGDGSGWSVDKTAAQKQINDFLADSIGQLKGTLPEAEIGNVIHKLRSSNSDLNARILNLYSQVYKFEFTPTSGTKQAVSVTSEPDLTKFKGQGGTLRVTLMGGTGLKHVLKKFTVGVDSSGVTGTITKNSVPFSWDEAQYLSNWLNASKSGSSGPDIYAATVASMVTGTEFDKVTRRNAAGDLEINDGSGFKSLEDWAKGRDMCQTVGGIGADTASCVANALACMKDNADGKPIAIQDATCMGALKDPNLWKATKDDIKKVNPRAAFMLLKNLGFKGKKAGNTVKCESYADWEKRTTDNELTDDSGSKVTLSTTDHTEIKNALAHLKPFLELVIGYVDSNPAILNQGSGHSSGSLSTNDPFGLSRPRGNHKDSALGDIRNQAVSSLDHVHVYISGLMAALGQNPVITLTGGANVPGYLAPSGTAPLKHKVQRFSHRLREVYDHYVQRLNGMNKDLSQATKDRVDSVFDNLKTKEDELLKWVEYLERYYEVSTLRGDMRGNTISQSDLEDAYKQYERNLGKLRKRTVNLVDILATLSNATNDAEGSGSVALPSSA